MESGKYRRFLEAESKIAPIEKKRSPESDRFWISWKERVDRVTFESGTSDIIDSLYFGEDLSRAVVIDRGVARIIQERIRGLEEENIRLHKLVRIMKIVIYGLVFAASLAVIALLSGSW